jgi:hypothetical protein
MGLVQDAGALNGGEATQPVGDCVFRAIPDAVPL